MSSSIHYEQTNVTNLLRCWLSKRVVRDGFTWLDEKRKQIAEGVSVQVFLTSFSTLPRYTGKKDLELTSEELRAAEAMRSGWSPSHWSVDQAARTLILLALPHDDAQKYLWTLEQVFTTVDVGELIALYQSLPLLPYPEWHCTRAAEGVRSNMTTVFNAVALHNPYPSDYFDNIAWNQMVLKAIFAGSSLHLILGLDDRANSELAQMLTDYAHERWAANRPVTPELWRLVGRFADAGIVADLEKVLNDADLAQQEAAALACSECSLLKAQELLACKPQLHSSINLGHLTWSSFSNKRLAVCQ